MRKVSKKQAKRNALYAEQRPEYMSRPENLVCHRCQQNPSDHLHHRHKRGIYTNAEEWFSALCLWCHQWVHDNEKQARKEGWIID